MAEFFVGMQFDCSDGLVRTITQMDDHKVTYTRQSVLGEGWHNRPLTFAKSQTTIHRNLHTKAWRIRFPAHVSLPRGA